MGNHVEVRILSSAPSLDSTSYIGIRRLDRGAHKGAFVVCVRMVCETGGRKARSVQGAKSRRSDSTSSMAAMQKATAIESVGSPLAWFLRSPTWLMCSRRTYVGREALLVSGSTNCPPTHASA